MLSTLRTSIVVVAILTLLATTSPGLCAEDNINRTLPGTWDLVGYTAEQGGIIPPYGEETFHRPALAINPTTHQPSVLLHRHGVLDLVCVTREGNMLEIDKESGTGRELVPWLEYSSYRSLAFDPVGNRLFAVVYDSGFGYRLLEEDLTSGVSTRIARLSYNWSIAFDPHNNSLISARVFPGGDGQYIVTLFTISPDTGMEFEIASCSISSPDIDLDYPTAMTFDAEAMKLYALIRANSTDRLLVSIDPLTAEITPIRTPLPEHLEVQGLAFDGASGMLYTVSAATDTLLRINPETGALTPVGTGVGTGGYDSSLVAINVQQDGLFLAEADESRAEWLVSPIVNEQDDCLIDGFITHGLSGGVADPNMGRIDGMSLFYWQQPGEDAPKPLVAWAQRVNDSYSEILVAIGEGSHETGWEFFPLGVDSFGTPSNHLPGVSRTLRNSTDPVIVVDSTNRPIVAWKEEIAPGQFEIYVRGYDFASNEWLEMELGSATSLGISDSDGTANSFDMALYDGEAVIACPRNGYIAVFSWDEVGQVWGPFSQGSAASNGISGPTGGDDSQPTISVHPGSDFMLVTWCRGETRVVESHYNGGDFSTVMGSVRIAPEVKSPVCTTTFGGEQIVAWQEEQTTPWSQVLASYFYQEVWDEIGSGSMSGGGVGGSPADSTYPKLEVGPDAKPVLAWEEDGGVVVRKFNLSLESDCDGDGIIDSIELAQGLDTDCNLNGLPDDCDLASGAETDCNDNGVLDYCEINVRIRTGELSPIGYNNPQSAVIPFAPEAQSEVLVLVRAYADIDSPVETIDLQINGENFGTHFTHSGESCWLGGFAQWNYVPAETFNNVRNDGELVLDLLPSPYVGPLECNRPTWVEVEIDYESFADCDGNGILDECELVAGGADCNNNGVLDHCEFCDSDGNGFVDLDDYNAFIMCMEGPQGSEITPQCLIFDANCDGAVDLEDFTLFTALMSAD